jgi:hypothetical protein
MVSAELLVRVSRVVTSTELNVAPDHTLLAETDGSVFKRFTVASDINDRHASPNLRPRAEIVFGILHDEETFSEETEPNDKCLSGTMSATMDTE